MAESTKENKYEIFFDELGRAVWHCDYMSEYGNRFVGTFVFRPVLSAIEEIQTYKLYKSLIGHYNKAEESAELFIWSKTVNDLAFALASLKFRVIKSPPFWHDAKTYGSTTPQNEEIIYNIPGGHIDDPQLIFYVWGAAVEASLQYKQKMVKEAEESYKKIKEHIEKIKEQINDKDDKEAIKDLMEERPVSVTKTYEVDDDEVR